MASSASTSVKPLTILTEDDGVPGSKIEQDPQHYTVDQLKRWLKCRSLKQSGKREEIVQRVASCLQGPITMFSMLVLMAGNGLLQKF